ARRRNRVLRQPDGDRQTFGRGQGPRGDEHDLVRLRAGARVLAGRADRPGIIGKLLRLHAVRQRSGGRDVKDRKLPAITGDVPIELVVIVKIADLAIGGVDDAVDVLATVYDPIGISDINAFPALDLLLVPIFRLSIAFDRDNIKIHLRLAARRIDKSQ